MADRRHDVQAQLMDTVIDSFHEDVKEAVQAQRDAGLIQDGTSLLQTHLELYESILDSIRYYADAHHKPIAETLLEDINLVAFVKFNLRSNHGTSLKRSLSSTNSDESNPSESPPNSTPHLTNELETGRRGVGRLPQPHQPSSSELLQNLPKNFEAARARALAYFQSHYEKAQSHVLDYLQNARGISFDSLAQSQALASEINEILHVAGLRLLDPESSRPGYLFVSKAKASRVQGGYFRLRMKTGPNGKRDASRAYRDFPKFQIATSPRRLDLPEDPQRPHEKPAELYQHLQRALDSFRAAAQITIPPGRTNSLEGPQVRDETPDELSQDLNSALGNIQEACRRSYMSATPYATQTPSQQAIAARLSQMTGANRVEIVLRSGITVSGAVTYSHATERAKVIDIESKRSWVVCLDEVLDARVIKDQ